MQKIAHFLVKFHMPVFLATIALALVCGVMSLQVHVNSDMSKYLPANMEVRQGMDVMNQEFGESNAVNLMATVPPDERQALADDLQKFEHVSNVQYDPDDPYYNQGENALYSVNIDSGAYSDYTAKAVELMRTACDSRGYACWVDGQALDSATASLGPVLVFAVIIATVILFALAASWLDPLLLLFTICIAVLINLGTNIVFGSISDVTAAIGAILQMALSMDYLIMIMNRFRRERAGGAVDSKVAMERALAGGITAVASSSLTTVVGLLCLVPMSFTIGKDLGLVLAKGVALSLVCAFAILPTLVLKLEYFMDRLSKPALNPTMKLFGAFSFKVRHAAAVLLVVVVAVGWAGKGLAQPSYLAESKNPDHAVVQQAFSPRTQVVVLFDSSEGGLDPASNRAGKLEQRLAEIPHVAATQSYLGTVGKPYTAEEAADQMGMDPAMVRMVYYRYFAHDPNATLTGRQLADYVRNGLGRDMGDLMSESQKEKMGSLADMVEADLSPSRSYTAAQAQQALSGHASIHEGMTDLFYLAYFANHGKFDPSWRMSTEQLINFVVDVLMDDPAFKERFDQATRTQLKDAQEAVADGRASFIGQSHGRIILNVDVADDSPEMSELVSQLHTVLDEQLGAGTYQLVGQGPMVQEMAASFSDELNFISMITIVAILVIVLLTFRNLLIPVVLVALIQGAYCWNLLLTGLFGDPIYYIAMLSVQAILMGATIDYAILYTTSYREARLTLGVRESVLQAYQHSIHTVMMSGSILVLVCLVLGLTAGGVTGQVCLTISSGAACAVALVLLVLPGALAALDRWIRPKGSVAA
ncbi:MAG: MMPL family transporter [Coriobacteriia bacterium]|nr:MMPL family transporter [Coriobacteriia bacterium]